MDNYIHKQDHNVELNCETMPLSEIVLLVNIEEIDFTPAELTKFNKMINNLTPALRHIMQIYIFVHKIHYIYPLTKEEHKYLNALVRLFNIDAHFAKFYILNVYLPSSTEPYSEYYTKLFELLKYPSKYDWLNPFLWEYHYDLRYYILKANILYSYLIPMNGPIFWLIRYGKTSAFSLVQIVPTTSCIDCKKTLPVVSGMFKTDMPENIVKIQHNIWKRLCDRTGGDR